MTFKIQSSQLN
ncbi:unnamed protein product [Cuscuta europaea]|uniref:Uncharacterized protein n=1 Tax=Cuscuta europaea TaxID=41803 RepID=A0A9P0YZ88_CUSEU|nr:unnamed protein product [Cuscuta europaea]